MILQVWDPTVYNGTLTGSMEEAQSLREEDKDAVGCGEPNTEEGHSVTEGGLGLECKRSLSVQDAWAIYRQIRFQEQSEENQIVSLILYIQIKLISSK